MMFLESVRPSTRGMASMDQSKLRMAGLTSRRMLTTGRWTRVRRRVTRLLLWDAGLSLLENWGRLPSRTMSGMN